MKTFEIVKKSKYVEEMSNWINLKNCQNYFLTITFRDISIKCPDEEIQKYLNSFVFKIDRNLKNPLNQKISTLIAYPEDSFHKTKRGYTAAPHIHGILQIPHKFHEKFIRKCTTDSLRKIKTRMGLIDSIILNENILIDTKSILHPKDHTMFPAYSNAETFKEFQYMSKNINTRQSSFTNDDLIIVQNNFKPTGDL